jgi:hypothetical protein
MLPYLAAGLMGAGAIGALTQKKPKYNSAAMDEIAALIQKQYTGIDSYFKEADTAFEGQYQNLYGSTMQSAVDNLANSGIYESPVSQNQINRTQVALGEQYASGKSQLAGQRLSAIGAVDQQRISYLQNLSSLQYQKQQAKYEKQSQMYGMLGGLGSAMLGVK